VAHLSNRKVLLIGWDGADWAVISPLMERGEMPHLERLVNEGVMGKLASFQPMYSPLIWNSIATGKFPDKHGIIGFAEVDEQSGETRASTSLSRKCKAIWNILSQEGLRTHVINWFAGHPAEPINGVCISELFGREMMRPIGSEPELARGTVHPEALREKVKEFWVTPQDIDAETIHLFVPKFAQVDQYNDRRLETIACMLAECLSVHTATAWVMEHEAWDFLAIYYGAIDHFCHGFMRYHPPRLEWVNQHDYELYKDVVDGAYRLHDLLLGRLIQLAGPQATVILCSDHGWRSGHLRPRGLPPVAAGPAEEHRPVGVLVMRGPGVAKDGLVHGASVLDITPTVLSVFGLPVGRDMDGRVLMEAFSDAARTPQLIPSWEEMPGPAGMHPPGTRFPASDSQALLDQFVALGYIDRPQGNAGKLAEMTREENQWNMARVHVFSRRFAKALPLLEDLYHRNPLRLDYGVMLSQCQFLLGLKTEAFGVVQDLAAAFPGEARAKMLLGIAEYHFGRPDAALAHLTALEKARPSKPYLFVYLGKAYFHLRRYPQALHAYQRALSIDQDTAAAHLGVARCLFRSRSYAKAADSALRALGVEFALAEAHFCLGRSWARLGKTKEAIQALETGLRFQAGRADMHEVLAMLYRQLPDAGEKAAEHARLRIECARLQTERRERLRQLRKEIAARAKEREARHEEASRQLMINVANVDLPSAGPARAEPAASRRVAPGSSGKEFLVVSGVPRSGTSLMMQMLAAGGVPLMTDGQRAANEDNPEGYFEWEPLRQLRRNPRLIEQTEGKAVKVVSMLLPVLPRNHRYKVIFMRRPAREIVASQAKMLARSGRSAPDLDPGRAIAVLHQHQEMMVSRIRNIPNVKSLVVNYPALVADPGETVARIRAFLGDGILRAPETMASVVKPHLYRQRVEALEATLP